MIAVPPELRGPSGTVYVMEGSPLTKNLTYKEVNGLPPPYSFTWLFSGSPFHGNGRVMLLDDNQTVSITRALRTDSGMYQLVVASGSGQATLQLDLHVTCSCHYQSK